MDFAGLGLIFMILLLVFVEKCQRWKKSKFVTDLSIFGDMDMCQDRHIKKAQAFLRSKACAFKYREDEILQKGLFSLLTFWLRLE